MFQILLPPAKPEEIRWWSRIHCVHHGTLMNILTGRVVGKHLSSLSCKIRRRCRLDLEGELMLHAANTEPSCLLLGSWPVSMYAAEAGELCLLMDSRFD